MTGRWRRDPRVAIFTDDPGWHGRALQRALAAHAIETIKVSLKDCAFALVIGAPTVLIPGFDGALPRACFVRGVPGGSLEEVVLRLDFLHALELLGIAVFNTGRAIERTVDKAMTSFRLALHGLATPATWVYEAAGTMPLEPAARLAAGQSLVAKPLFGSQGEGVRRVDSTAVGEVVGGVHYLQDYVARDGPPFRDVRVLVIAGRARYAMERVSLHWVTNRAQGARCLALKLTAEISALAEAASQAIDIDYAGVDLMQDHAGDWWIGEVNGIPAWWGLQQTTPDDITAALAEAFVAKIVALETH